MNIKQLTTNIKRLDKLGVRVIVPFEPASETVSIDTLLDFVDSVSDCSSVEMVELEDLDGDHHFVIDVFHVTDKMVRNLWFSDDTTEDVTQEDGYTVIIDNGIHHTRFQVIQMIEQYLPFVDIIDLEVLQL